jgi:Xaa-Pro aminopeptidase
MLVLKLQSYKDSKLSISQLNSIQKACRITTQTFIQINKLIRPGQTEKEVAYKIRKILLASGAQSLAFRPIVACGSGSAQPHHKNTTRIIKTNDIILLDFGCKFNGFCSDLSRTIFIGQPKPEWLKVYDIVKTAQQKAIDFLNTKYQILNTCGLRASQFDAIVRDFITKKGYGKNFIHGLGHGLGSRVHQYFKINPKSKNLIRTGMVFTVEPGIYLKGLFGVRHEDVIYLTSNSIKILTTI